MTASLLEAAEGLGFRRRRAAGRNGLRTHRLNGLTLGTTRDWAWLTQDLNGSLEAADALRGTAVGLRGSSTAPGLWRRVAAEPHDTPQRTFEITPTMFAPRTAISSAQWRAVLEWAVSTADGEVPSGWDSPNASDVASWVPTDSLTVRVGSKVRQGRVIHNDDRLAIEFPWVTSLPDGLPAAREAWLEALLLDAQRTWRLARVCRAPDGSAVASCDLTGAPVDLLPTISRAAVDALRWVTSWVVPPSAFITDLSRESRFMDAGPLTARFAAADVP